ncbi:S-layer homology domain-containing protein [Bacillus horti]|uniref:SLH domain-containing protein n=1 Tax=Caldalkalibacillus horti TaxID=77523 RepID=A0ABT9VZF7_9BACI|nr:S-layer homology domain-containing protein [Bacillus horti]MDQ0166364.1 hypothetical protein [Bacillus horti]
MRQKFIVTTLLCTLLLSLIFPSVLSANTLQNFDDVPTAHWAEKFIKKMDIRNVVEGYENNTFRPNQGIRQQEAVAMIVRFLGYQDEAEAAKSLEVREDHELYPYIQGVPEWSKGNILVGAQLGLISLASDAGFNPTEEASRAWMTKLLITSIQKHGSVPATTSNLQFTDSDSIPPWVRSEVNLATGAEIVTGYPDGTFKPERTVTRAEMTALLAKAEEFVSSDYLKDIVRGKIEVKQEDGAIVNTDSGLEKIFIQDDALLFQENNRISFAQLKSSDEISAIIDSNDQVLFLDLLNASERKVNEIEGTVYVYDASKELLTIQDQTQNLTSFKVASTVTVNKDNKAIRISELNTFDKVRITLEEGELKHIEVTESYEHQKEAEIISINTTERVVTVKHADHSYEVISINNRVKLLDQQGAHISFDQLKMNEKVKINYHEDQVDSIQIPVSHMSDYVITQVNTRRAIVTKDGVNEEYNFDSSLKVLIKGYIEPSSTDLLVGDRVKLKLSDGKIVEIEVLNRERKAFNFDFSDSSANAIRVKDLKTNQLSYITYDSDVKLYQNNSALRSLTSFNQGDRVLINIRDGVALRIDKAIFNNFDITARDDANKTITARNRQYSNQTFRFADHTVVIVNNTTSHITNILVGDGVNIYSVGNEIVEIRK